MIRRGDFVLVAAPGDYGKPRPALVIQSDLFSALPSATVCLLTSLIRDDVELIRLTVEPSVSNGLQQMSQLLIDKIITLPRAKISRVIGHADDELMLSVSRALALFLAIV